MKKKRLLITSLMCVTVFISGGAFYLNAQQVQPSNDFLEMEDCYDEIVETHNPNDDVIKCGILGLCKFKCGRPAHNAEKGRCLEI